MKNVLSFCVLIITAFAISLSLSDKSSGQSRFPSYYSADQFGLTSPGAMRYGLYGYVNPAVLSSLDQGDLLFTFSDQNGNWSNFNHWGIFAAVPHVGFGVVHQKDLPGSVTDYKFSLGFGNREIGIGFGYGWSHGDFTYVNRADLFTFGALYRPITYLSFGFIGNVPSVGNSEGALDFAVRPFKDEKLSLFGDYVFGNNRNSGDIRWSAGAAVEAFPGIRITGRYFDTKFFNVGVELSLGHLGIFTNTNYDKNGNHSYNIYGIRVGGYDRNIFPKIFPHKDYVELNLNGETKYQKYILFDNSNTLLNLIKQIKAAKNDNSISGIAINTSGMSINRELLWELRKELQEFKSAGKHVVVYIDQTGIDGYHFASVADKIVMDPMGIITLEGYLWGRNYYKGTLEKLGIGFHEWRYFKFKSAYETFSLDSMSEADKIQLQAVVDEYYKQAKDDICLSRNIDGNRFDDLVNNNTLFDPDEALKAGLVDTLGRWDKVKDIIKEIEGKNRRMISPGSLAKFHLPEDNYWGEKPEIAVIYAIGECAMDAGIKARSLVKDVEGVTNDSRVKAVVFRVDSPGGDALASDIVSEALKKCKEKKPVIVSQGFVAASGGYWLSMYADTIIAAPTTITGSIGVIGGWFYNKQLESKLGVSTGYVKKGEHADLFFGMHIPLIGLTLPDRDLNATEQDRIDSLIKSSYNTFVGKVAMGRKLSVDSVKAIAQGRVWSGEAGLHNGLVDVPGGLSDAINIAADKSGLKNRQYKIVEYPSPPLFNLNQFMPSIFGFKIQSKEDPLINNIKFRLEHNGEVMPILPLEDMDMLLYK
jgi:protease IV